MYVQIRTAFPGRGDNDVLHLVISQDDDHNETCNTNRSQCITHYVGERCLKNGDGRSRVMKLIIECTPGALRNKGIINGRQ